MLELPSIGKFNELHNGTWELKDNYENGNLGYEPLGLKPTDPEKLITMQNTGLNNGRLAMMALQVWMPRSL